MPIKNETIMKNFLDQSIRNQHFGGGRCNVIRTSHFCIYNVDDNPIAFHNHCDKVLMFKRRTTLTSLANRHAMQLTKLAEDAGWIVARGLGRPSGR